MENGDTATRPPQKSNQTDFPHGIEIYPDHWYTDDTAYRHLVISKRTLSEARRKGKLRYARVAGQACFKGQWLIEWLERIAVGPTVAVPSCRSSIEDI